MRDVEKEKANMNKVSEECKKSLKQMRKISEKFRKTSEVVE